ncbi:MAG: DUF423 domain-containing protein [Planctomycetota bacterium]
MMVHRATLIAAGIAGATAITIGAFGAHGLEDQLAAAGMDSETIERRLPQFETGARYHLAHALALLTLSVLPLPPGRLCSAITWLIVAGIVLFSGSLYTLVITNTPWLGAITPIGGVCWIAAWSLVAVLGIHHQV